MDAICKKNYPFCNDDDVKGTNQVYIIGETYKYEKIYYNGQTWYRVYSSIGKTDLFDKEDFKDYFQSESEIRKLKLLKIKRLLFKK